MKIIESVSSTTTNGGAARTHGTAPEYDALVEPLRDAWVYYAAYYDPNGDSNTCHGVFYELNEAVGDMIDAHPADAVELGRWADGVERLERCWKAYVAFDAVCPPEDDDAFAAHWRAEGDARMELENVVRDLVGGPTPRYRDAGEPRRVMAE